MDINIEVGSSSTSAEHVGEQQPQQLGNFHCGCAGYSYNDWVGNFYPRRLVGTDSDRQFNYYQQNFSTIEINGTFYGHPTDAMIQKWKALAGPKFRMVLKANKSITHDMSPGGPQLNISELEIFLKRSLPLQDVLAMILIQCPSHKTVTLDDLKRIRDLLAKPPFVDASRKNRIPLAFEFRNNVTIQDKYIQAFLREQGWTTVYHPNTTSRYTKAQVKDVVESGRPLRQEYLLQSLSDMTKAAPPTSNVVYVRLHGGRDDHAYDYNDKDLEPIARQIHQWRKQGLTVYAYFLNCLPPQPWGTDQKEEEQRYKDLTSWSVMPKNAIMLKRKVHGLAKESVPLAPKQPRSTITSLFSMQPTTSGTTRKSSTPSVVKRKSPWGAQTLPVKSSKLSANSPSPISSRLASAKDKATKPAHPFTPGKGTSSPFSQRHHTASIITQKTGRDGATPSEKHPTASPSILSFFPKQTRK